MCTLLAARGVKGTARGKSPEIADRVSISHDQAAVFDKCRVRPLFIVKLIQKIKNQRCLNLAFSAGSIKFSIVLSEFRQIFNKVTEDSK
jgi:hypothetical protein